MPARLIALLAFLIEAATGAPAPKTAIEWVTIEGGAFLMGSDTDAARRDGPAHKVTVPTFQIAKTEVTIAQYQACVTAGACEPAHLTDGKCGVWGSVNWVDAPVPKSFYTRGDLPAVCLDWFEAVAFSKWVGGRLPTEAEWEFAARSRGKEKEYPWGPKEGGDEHAVMNPRKVEPWCPWGTRPVCSKPKGRTEQGLCDMSGNAQEWVEDWYSPSYRTAPTDGSAQLNQSIYNKVLRGGHFCSYADCVRTRDRLANEPTARYYFVGFRPARAMPPRL